MTRALCAAMLILEAVVLALTTPVLIGGDSGGLLITANREALGLAVGFVPVADRRVMSVFVTAASVLQREGATFI